MIGAPIVLNRWLAQKVHEPFELEDDFRHVIGRTAIVNEVKEEPEVGDGLLYLDEVFDMAAEEVICRTCRTVVHVLADDVFALLSGFRGKEGGVV